MIFDVDGTLLHASGAGRAALERALERCFGVQVQLDGTTFAGKSDLVIFKEAVAQLGLSEPVVADRWCCLVEWYLAFLQQELDRRPVRVLPGVRPLLEYLGSVPGVACAVGTGNLERAARYKLQRVGLEGFFAAGGFAEDGEDRAEILGVAHRRAQSRLGRPLWPVVVVGDTPLDMEAAARAGFVGVAVATGPFSEEQLRNTPAARVVRDLSRWEEVAHELLSVFPPGLKRLQ